MPHKPIAAGKSSFELIDPDILFKALALRETDIFLDVACGKGAYSIAAARFIRGTGRVYAVDLWEEGIMTLKHQIAVEKLENIMSHVVDVSQRLPVETGSIDVCLMATVLHDLIEDQTDQGALQEVKRVLKTQGKFAVIEFKKIDGPPGPPVHIRLSPEDVEYHLQPYAFHLKKVVDLGPHNYLALFLNE